MLCFSIVPSRTMMIDDDDDAGKGKKMKCTKYIVPFSVSV